MAEDPLTVHARARVGRVLRNKWTLDKLIGVGGMAAVYAATHRNGSKVAIKMLHPTLMFDTGFANRLVQEGYVANKIDHPAAVKVFDDDTDEVDGAVFLVMELLEGQTLSGLRRHRKKIPEIETLKMMAPVCECLGQAHRKGIIHRDIKPENLFVTRDGVVHVLDFGIARISDGSNVNATRTGMVVGSPAYMSPEQALGKMNSVGPQTDVYALGATMFALLTGTTPHAGESTQEMIVMVATQAARSIKTVMPDVKPSVMRIIDRALSYERDQRYPDAGAMLVDIQAAIAEIEDGGPRVLPTFAEDDEEGETKVSGAIKPPSASAGADESRPSAPMLPGAGMNRVGQSVPNNTPAPFPQSPAAGPPAAPGVSKVRAATLAPAGLPNTGQGLPPTQAIEAFPMPGGPGSMTGGGAAMEPYPGGNPQSISLDQTIPASSLPQMPPMYPMEPGSTSGPRPGVNTGMAWAGASAPAEEVAPPQKPKSKTAVFAVMGLVVLLGGGLAVNSMMSGGSTPAHPAAPVVRTVTPTPAPTNPTAQPENNAAANPGTPENPPANAAANPAAPENPPANPGNVANAQPEAPPTPPAQPEAPPTPPAQPEAPPANTAAANPPAQAEAPPSRPSRGDGHESRSARRNSNSNSGSAASANTTTGGSNNTAGGGGRRRRRQATDPLGY